MVWIMKVKIQAYWNAQVKVAPSEDANWAETLIKEGKNVTICDIIINDKLVGTIVWNGKELKIQPPEGKDIKAELRELDEHDKDTLSESLKAAYCSLIVADNHVPEGSTLEKLINDTIANVEEVLEAA